MFGFIYLFLWKCLALLLCALYISFFSGDTPNFVIHNSMRSWEILFTSMGRDFKVLFVFSFYMILL